MTCTIMERSCQLMKSGLSDTKNGRLQLALSKVKTEVNPTDMMIMYVLHTGLKLNANDAKVQGVRRWFGGLGRLISRGCSRPSHRSGRSNIKQSATKLLLTRRDLKGLIICIDDIKINHSPTPPLPKKRPDFVDEDGGGGF